MSCLILNMKNWNWKKNGNMRIISEDALQKQITARRKKRLEYLTVPEAAELAGVEPATIAFWVYNRKNTDSENQERLFVFQEKRLDSGY